MNWKKLLISESEKSYWEILHNSDKKIVMLHYVPEEDYSEKDIKIELTYDQFEDLIKFILRIK